MAEKKTMSTHQLRELVDSARHVIEEAEFTMCAETDFTETKNYMVPYTEMRRLAHILTELGVIPYNTLRRKKKAS